MTLPDRRQVLRFVLLAGMSGTGAVSLSGCIGSGIGLNLAADAGPEGLDPSRARIITTAAHIAKGASLTSAYRAGRGLGPVTANSQLQRMAEGYALAMARTGKVQHSIGIGDNFVRRLYASGYDAQEAAENIAGGFDTIEEAMIGWQNSAGHRKNLLKPAVREIGLGVSRNPTTHLETYWAMVLGVQVRA